VILNPTQDTTTAEQMVHTQKMNTLALLTSVVLVETEGDVHSWELNMAALPRETLYQLQDGVITEHCAREGCALQILTEHKANLEQVSHQRDDLVAHN